MRHITIFLSFFILSGCAKGEPARLAEPNQSSPSIVNSEPANIAVNTQKPNRIESDKKYKVIKGGETCEEYLLKKIATETTERSRIVRLDAFNTDDENLSKELKDWLQKSIHKEMLVTYELRYKKNRVLVLRANVAAATGIAANFTNWFVQLDIGSINFRSLSEDPNLIFWDKSGTLNYYSIDYGGEFLKNKDWDNLTLDLRRFKLDPDRKPELIGEERDIRCK